MILRSIATPVLLACVVLAGAVHAQAPGAAIVTAQKDAPDVLLDWAAVPTALSYQVERTDDLINPFVLIGSVPSGPYRDSGAVPGPPTNPALYYYRVIAYNASGAGPPSNLAFKINLRLDDTVEGRLVSIPYVYRPLVPKGPTPNSLDLCAENPDLKTVYGTGLNCDWRGQLCAGIKKSFDVVAGEAYSFIPTVPTVLDLVGAHDPDMIPGGPRSVSLPCVAATPCPRFYRRLISPPYHGTATTAAGLCAELSAQGQGIRAVETHSTIGLHSTYHFCGAALPDFPLVVGEGYYVHPTGDLTWQPELR